MKRDRGTRAFTLIELLVVCAIIGILATIMLAKIRHAIRQARNGKARAEIHTLHTGFDMCMADRGYYPQDVGPGTLPEGMNQYLNGWPASPFGDDKDGYDWDCYAWPQASAIDSVVVTEWCAISFRGEDGNRSVAYDNWDNTWASWINSPGDDLFEPVARNDPVYWSF